MLEEKGTVVDIEPDALWVETRQQSVCGSCVARKGCGQQVLGQMFATTSTLRVLLGDRSPEDFQTQQTVTIGIPEAVVVKNSLLIYLVPLAGFLAGAGLGQQWLGAEGLSVLLAFIGLGAGGLAMRWYSWRIRHDPACQPVILDESVNLPDESESVNLPDKSGVVNPL